MTLASFIALYLYVLNKPIMPPLYSTKSVDISLGNNQFQ